MMRTDLWLVVGRHPFDGLLIHSDRLSKLAVISMQAAQVEQGRDLCGLVCARVLQPSAVQCGAVPVHGGGRLPLTGEAEHQTLVQVGHCRPQGWCQGPGPDRPSTRPRQTQ